MNRLEYSSIFVIVRAFKVRGGGGAVAESEANQQATHKMWMVHEDHIYHIRV